MGTGLEALREAAEDRRRARRDLKHACVEAGPEKVTAFLDERPDDIFIWETITQMMYPQWGEFPWA